MGGSVATLTVLAASTRFNAPTLMLVRLMATDKFNVALLRVTLSSGMAGVPIVLPAATLSVPPVMVMLPVLLVLVVLMMLLLAITLPPEILRAPVAAAAAPVRLTREKPPEPTISVPPLPTVT